jgi:hypothetical protein
MPATATPLPRAVTAITSTMFAPTATLFLAAQAAAATTPMLAPVNAPAQPQQKLCLLLATLVAAAVVALPGWCD